MQHSVFQELDNMRFERTLGNETRTFARVVFGMMFFLRRSDDLGYRKRFILAEEAGTTAKAGAGTGDFQRSDRYLAAATRPGRTVHDDDRKLRLDPGGRCRVSVPGSA